MEENTNTDKKMGGMNTKTLLSTLWIFILLNIIFRDLHEVISPGFLTEALTGYVNGQQITEELIFIGALIVEVPTVMVLLSRLLKYKINRWANIVASVITIAVVLSAVPKLPADIFFAAIEIIALLAIIRIAWKWRSEEE